MHKGREGIEMNALDLAELFETYAVDHKPDGWPAIRQDTLNSTAAILRRQHEAIKVLRESMRNIQSRSSLDSYVNEVAKYALKNTEGI